MWRAVAPRLANRFTVVCADLRGCGRSGCPDSSADHNTWYTDAGGPLAIWRAWADDVRGGCLEAGHFFPEEIPNDTADALARFFAIETTRG